MQRSENATRAAVGRRVHPRRASNAMGAHDGRGGGRPRKAPRNALACPMLRSGDPTIRRIVRLFYRGCVTELGPECANNLSVLAMVAQAADGLELALMSADDEPARRIGVKVCCCGMHGAWKLASLNKKLAREGQTGRQDGVLS